MARSWFVTPYRIIPGRPVPGRYDSSYGGWDGPSPRDMEHFRGPADTCALAVELAVVWRKEGKRSDLWLLMVEDGLATHCNKFDDQRAEHKHDFQTGGKCATCNTRCPHPLFTDTGHLGKTCPTCGCLEPWEGQPDHYEIPLGLPKPCRLVKVGL